MSVLHSSQNLMCSEMEVMMMDSSNNLACWPPSSPEVEMMLERYICNYGPSSSSLPSIFMKEEEFSSDQESDHQAQHFDQAFLDRDGTTTINVNTIDRNNLVRQSSSPPEFFSHLTPHNNGFTAMRGDGRLGNDQLNFSSGSPTCSRKMPQIAENGNDSNWDNNSSLNGLERTRDHNDVKMFSSSTALEIQQQNTVLAHHLSLPKDFGMPSREKVLHFQGSVPCKIRAKRGFATHPRSIAERVRRTRISERMRRLEDLFPNIDKQTSIADKLELAVEYIKDLQKQVKTLADTKANCSCSSKQKQHSNPCG
ncbi:hypothetical protein L484_010917 [Morus notabilis]|uniref:BHLH domain-containing protein n=1 Tax=Morus notabilis TaxID=981085 RepID=W9S7W9_9ROSA|nr:transcription factor bHLH130 [Morus notabilis]EXB93778.1 hypothetical protein L484_010917 [Morus notabilis]